ncbi:MFS transporter [Acuticoccus sediminis]|uniref:MFS transporter n=1 Tax=Acuticoccus sediminis TaxID=2184697 RepID=A0A8B2NPX2_9HYPH|nr:MFS transporter [Acuticoccus sediminis]RAI01936.1 MFS transporter [Acuticoccus sediminis]
MTTTAPAPDALWRSRHRVICALGVTQILSWGTTYYLLAVLAKPIAAATGWGYGWVIGGLSLGLLASGLVSIRVGRLIDDRGGRPVLAASSVLIAVGLAALAMAPSLPVYMLAWLVLGTGMGAGLYDAAFSTLGRLYGARGRSAITSLTLWGGFASSVCWPLSAFLVDSVGWRGACLIYAAVQIAVCLPLHLFAIPAEAPRERFVPADEPASPRPRAAPARTRLVVLLSAIITTMGIVAVTWSVHLIAFLEAQGITVAAAVTLGALVGPAQVGARVIEMLGRGRHHPIWTATAAVLLVATGITLLWVVFPIPALALVAYGAGSGIFSIARGTLPLALFGPDGYARLMGRLATPTLIAQAIAPSATALLLETAGASVTLGALVTLATLNILAVMLLWVLARPRSAGATT